MKLETKHYVILGCVVAVIAAFLAGAYLQEVRPLNLQSIAPSRDASGEYATGSDSGMMGNGAYPERPSTIAPSPMPPYGSPSAGPTAADVDQKIIKNASLELSVDDVAATAAKITTIATESDGFVQQTDIQERTDGTKYGYITVRIPAKSFESAKERMKAEAKLVTRESVTGQDVTEQYTDLEAQLRNAQAQEAIYLDVLKKARTVEEILQVQNYLGQIRGQIESLQGRIQYLKNLTEYSTITVTLREEPSVRLPTKEFRPGTVVDEAIQSLVELGQFLVEAVIWIVIVGGGTILPLALIAWVLYLIFRRRKTR